MRIASIHKGKAEAEKFVRQLRKEGAKEVRVRVLGRGRFEVSSSIGPKRVGNFKNVGY